MFDNLGDSADHVADRIANLSSQMGTLNDDIDQYKEGIKGIFNNHGIKYEQGKNEDTQQ